MIGAQLVAATIAGADAIAHYEATGLWHQLHGAFYAELAPWLREHTPETSVVGGFNSGIVSYFSGRRTINLDGVMNDRALDALERRSLCAYLDDEKIDYLVDVEGEIDKFMDGFCGDVDWRARWNVVHRARWTFGGGEGTAPFVVFARASP